jgi:class 3 adenylate cyclase
MEDRPRERTWLCSVVFVDIVHYSVQSVTLEMNWKARLNKYLAASIQDVPEGDRVILDTGDGAAICFLGDPEAAMFCALRLLDGFVKEETGPVGMRARIGVNVGPVKLVRDINGNVNAIGDGINVGQRVMSFAKENQILVSRSFYEVASRVSDSYVNLFRFMGVLKDKHVREHALYELLPPGSVPPTEGRPDSGLRDAAAAPGTPRLGSAVATPRSPSAASAQPPVAPTARSARRTSPSLDPITAEKLERHLARILGPIARFLVRDASLRTETPDDAVRALAAHVPEPGEQARFLQAAAAELGLAVATPPATHFAAPLPRAPTPAERAASSFSPEVLERITRELAMFLGPVARVLVSRTAPGVPGEADLYAALAEHVADERDRAAFLAGAPPAGPAGEDPPPEPPPEG